MNRAILIPYTQTVVKKAIDLVGNGNSKTVDVRQLRNQIDDAILSNDKEVQSEYNEILSAIQAEPRLALAIRALIRPAMTLILTITFVALLYGQVQASDPGEKIKTYREVITVFLAIYGPIVGFWFGERSAERGVTRQPIAKPLRDE